MDFIPNEKKFIFTLLDSLLLLGAIACIVTIDRGQWILSNPAFYQPGGESLMTNSMLMDGSLTSGEVQSADAKTELIPHTGAIERAVARAGAGCLTSTGSPAWYDTYRSLTVFHSVDQHAGHQLGVLVVKNRCEG